MGQPVYCSAADAGMWGDRGNGDGSTPYAWLSSITLLPWLPGFPPLAFPTAISSLTSPQSVSSVNSSPHPRITPQSPNSSSQPLCLPGDRILVWGMYGYGKACLILIPFRLPQISCFTVSLKCFSSDSDSCPDMSIGPLLQFPHPPRASPVLLTLLFFPLVPSSWWVLPGSVCSFPLVRSSCLPSAGVLHALSCLMVYSWPICGKGCTPCPPTPLPSCSRSSLFFILNWNFPQSSETHKRLS